MRALTRRARYSDSISCAVAVGRPGCVLVCALRPVLTHPAAIMTEIATRNPATQRFFFNGLISASTEIVCTKTTNVCNTTVPVNGFQPGHMPLLSQPSGSGPEGTPGSPQKHGFWAFPKQFLRR